MRKKRKIKILFLDILTGDGKTRKELNRKGSGGGTKAESMRKASGLKKNEFITVDAHRGKFPEDLTRFQGIIIGGSLEDPFKGTEKPWVKRTYVIIRKAIKGKIPILGICGGLQFTVRALGGEVVLNPKGKEFGSIKVWFTKNGVSDPIFKGLGGAIMVASSHKCMARNLKSGWRLLASSGLCRVQAIAIGRHIRLLQFHPEMKTGELKNLARVRGLDEGVGRMENTKKAGKKILQNFLDHFVLPRVTIK